MTKTLLFLLTLCLFSSSLARDLQNTFTASVQTVATATVTSTKVLDANDSRRYLLIINECASGGATVTVKSSSAQTGSEGVVIPGAGNWEPLKSPVDALYIKASTGTCPVMILEGQ